MPPEIAPDPREIVREYRLNQLILSLGELGKEQAEVRQKMQKAKNSGDEERFEQLRMLDAAFEDDIEQTKLEILKLAPETPQ